MKAQEKKEIWVFLSHSNEDYNKVRKVRNMLEEQSLRPIMFFLKCLNDDDEIDSLIKREIDCRTRFILCDSENSRKSKWVQREIEYIKSQHKPYEIIDLSKSDEQILKQLKDVRRRTKLFISYSRQDYNLASAIYRRLSKYDYEVFVDYDNLNMGETFANRIKDEIESTVDSGCIIALLTENGIKSQWVNKEIEYARDYDKVHNVNKSSLIPIIVGDNIPEKYNDLSCITFSANTEDLVNKIVDSIILSLLRRGEIYTYYKNFKNGINSQIDNFEADRLAQLYYNLAKKEYDMDYPPGYMALGTCYEQGIGVPVDLEEAMYIYNSAEAGIGRQAAQRIYNVLYNKSDDK